MSNRLDLAIALRPQMLAYAFRLANNHRQDAEDLVQETYARAIPYIETADERVDEERGMRNLLFAICRNLRISNQRRAQNKALPLLDDWLGNVADESGWCPNIPHGLVTTETPETLAIEQEQSDILHAAIESELSDKARDLVYHLLAGVPPTEYARSRAEPVGTVAFRSWDARRKLAGAIAR